MKAGKAWGQTRPLLITPLVEVHEIVVVPNGFCSRHRHEHRWNAFYVFEGVLNIEVEQADYDLADVTTLGPGEMATVPPGLWHHFAAGPKGAKGIEVYYPTPLSGNDIKRSDVGGVGRRHARKRR